MILDSQKKLYRTKIDQFIKRLEALILSQYELLEAEFANSKDPVPFGERLRLQYQRIEEGQEWGQAWESAWFHLQGRIPEKWQEQEVVAHLDFNGEALIFSPQGDPLQGLTNGSVFGNVTRHTFILTPKAQGGETVDLWVEGAANSIVGINQPSDPPRGTVDRQGNYLGKVNRMRIARFHRELYALRLDMELLNGLLDTVPEFSTRHARILKSLVESTNGFRDDPDRAGICREILAPLLAHPAHSSAPTLITVGHAHIDTGFLWPVRETIRKAGRTFASQLDLIERYPDYVFGASQPQHYQFVKDHYPNLYERIKKAVAEGRWELQGGMWVEPDCNLISGESMVRQVMHGKNFFMDEFGVEVTNCWIPDVFGYSASMPQILKSAGIHYLLTQKMSWSQFNRFPYTTFRWRGIEGTEVLTHFPPEDNYNSELQPCGLQKAERQFVEKSLLDEMLCPFGVGDGGGGPTAEMIERGLRQQNLEGVPKVQFGRSDHCFERIAKQQDQLPVWSGELYLEMHRGTYTTQARTKRGNRLLEQSLRETEYLLALGKLKDYPIERLDGIWKKLLINQFHDILPGSSISEVYEVTEREHAEALEDCARIRAEAADKILQHDAEGLTVINTLNVPCTREIQLPEDWQGGLVDDSGNPIDMQQDSDGTLTAQLQLAPQAICTLHREGRMALAQSVQSLVMENDLVRYEFNEHGQLLSAFDKEMQLEMLAEGEPGNILTLYEDRPHDWDAWEVDISYEEMALETARGKRWTSTGQGMVRQGLKFELSIGQSTIKQKITLSQKSKALEFETLVEWQECHRMLRTAFPVNVHTDSATFDIQYGYVRRPTHRNTSWDMARFEVAGQKYADLSNHERGVALINNCKYGHKVHENVLDLNLLRSPTYPDPDADLGLHEFSYCLFIHQHELVKSGVIAEALQFNQPPLLFPGKASVKLQPPVRVNGKGVGLEVLKRAEKENCWIFRLVERYGQTGIAQIELLEFEARVQETNLLEWEDMGGLLTSPLTLKFKPFEIRTFKIRSGLRQGPS